MLTEGFEKFSVTLAEMLRDNNEIAGAGFLERVLFEVLSKVKTRQLRPLDSCINLALQRGA